MTSARAAIVDLLKERRADEALRRCAEALLEDPASAELLFLMGLAFEQAGLAERAIESLDRSLAIAPERIEALGAIANLHSRLNRPYDALNRLEQARRVDPNHPSVRFNLGNAYLAVGRPQDAIDEYEAATRLKPDHHGAWHQLAVARLTTQRAEDALVCVRRALALQDSSFDYRLTEAACLSNLGRWAETIAAYGAALPLAPTDWRGHAGLAICLTGIGSADAAEPHFLEAIRLAPGAAAAATIWSNYLMSLHYRCDVTTERLIAAHRAFQSYLPAAPRTARAPSSGKLRVGFVSGDFLGHPVGRFALPVLQDLNRDRFAAFAYSAAPAQDALTDRLRAACDGWRDVRGLDAHAAADLVRRDEIDILIDLSGHTSHRRLDIFALRPAAIQIGWLGYPGPYAWGGIDFRLSDALVDPAGEHGFGDQILRMDRTPLHYPAPTQAPGKSIGEGGLRFGSFNNLAKLDDRTLEHWSDLLDAFPGATLTLKGKGAGDPAFDARLARAFGGNRGRVTILDWATQESDHLARYAAIDIALDPLFYNGATTTCEALASGTPVLSRRGERPAGRMGDSLLASANLPEWVQPTTADAVEYLRARSVDLHADAIRMAMAASPLCDRKGFVASFEAALISSISAPEPAD